MALLSNSGVNWLLFPEAGADVIIFPWSLIYMTGALFWGMLARRAGFQRYVRTSKSSGLAHTWFLLSFGVAGAVVMSLLGTLVQSALDERSTFALNPEVAHALGAGSRSGTTPSRCSWNPGWASSGESMSGGTWSTGFRTVSGIFRTKR